MDIRRLNKITLANVYFLPLQSDLIAVLRNYLFISVIDCASFFYQFRVYPADRYKLAVISYRGQKVFNVAPMGYRNSPLYI